VANKRNEPKLDEPTCEGYVSDEAVRKYFGDALIRKYLGEEPKGPTPRKRRTRRGRNG
jgi:hypothetical protein